MYSLLLAYVLWFFGGLGTLGLHRHYLNKHGTGLVWLFTGGFFILGSAYDFFTLPTQVRDANMRKAIFDAGVASYSRLAPAPRVAKPTLEQAILRVARDHGGRVTPAQVAAQGEYNMSVCGKELERMVSKGFCEMRVTRSGAVVFHFPDFSPDTKDELEF